jgi:hypothetical protein
MARLIGFKELAKKLAMRKSMEFAKQLEFLVEKAMVDKSILADDVEVGDAEHKPSIKNS